MSGTATASPRPRRSLQQQPSSPFVLPRLLLQLVLLLAGGAGGGEGPSNGEGRGSNGNSNRSGHGGSSFFLSFGPRAAAAAAVNDNELHVTTSTTTDGRDCSVGPYGWFCEPSTTENDVQYYTPRVFQGKLGATPEGLAPLCVDECVPDCRPPCPAECVRKKFNLRSDDLLTGRAGVLIKAEHQFFVNPYNGSDAWPGSRSKPWETLKRAEAQVRFLRIQNTEAPDSSKLLDPVQIWVRNFDHMQEEDLEAQEENSRYMGYSIME